MEPAKKIRESQELCHGSPEKFSQGVSTELVRPFFQNFKIPNWLSICLSVFHSITTSQTQRSVKYGQDRGEGPPFQRGTAALDPAGVALTLAPGREVRGEQSAKVARDLKSGATCDARATRGCRSAQRAHAALSVCRAVRRCRRSSGLSTPVLDRDAGEPVILHELIPNPIDQNPWAHWRSPMDMMRQG